MIVEIIIDSTLLNKTKTILLLTHYSSLDLDTKESLQIIQSPSFNLLHRDVMNVLEYFESINLV